MHLNKCFSGLAINSVHNRRKSILHIFVPLVLTLGLRTRALQFDAKWTWKMNFDETYNVSALTVSAKIVFA